MPVFFEKKDRVGIITLSRPEARNAWGLDYYDALLEHFNDMEDDDDILCAILTGDDDGNAFSAGANIADPKTHTLNSAAQFIKDLPKRKLKPFEVLTNFPKPVIAAVNGYAIGIGCIVTFCCDLIVASDRAEWRLPQVALGILPAYGGAPRLARWVGKGQAMKLSMGFPLKAEEAYRIGLAQWLVPHDKLMGQAMEVAGHIASMPPLASRMVKESINHGLDIPNIADAALVDLYRFMALEMTDDKAEAHASWREKRSPVFRGQ
jgi:enoyl-CoA hydratase/carnithine racemase